MRKICFFFLWSLFLFKENAFLDEKKEEACEESVFFFLWSLFLFGRIFFWMEESWSLWEGEFISLLSMVSFFCSGECFFRWGKLKLVRKVYFSFMVSFSCLERCFFWMGKAEACEKGQVFLSWSLFLFEKGLEKKIIKRMNKNNLIIFFSIFCKKKLKKGDKFWELYKIQQIYFFFSSIFEKKKNEHYSLCSFFFFFIWIKKNYEL